MNRFPIRAALAALTALLAVPACAAAVSADEAQSGWVTEGKRHYYFYEDGTCASGETEIDGVPYLFAPNGVQQTCWQTVSGKRYFYDKDGSAVFGWVDWRGERYYVSQERGKLTEPDEIGGEAYQISDDGTLQHDCWLYDGEWHRLNADGLPVDGELLLDGTPYLFEDGVAALGWQTASDGITRRYAADADNSPYLCTGWLSLPEGRYYADPDAGRLSGAQTLDGFPCVFSADGVLEMQLAPDDSGALQCTDGSGTPVSGLTEIGGAVYNFDADGRPQTGLLYADGVRRYFADDGTMQTGWQEISGRRYYFGADGISVTGLAEIGGIRYGFYPNGTLCSGIYPIDGVTYCFGEDGTVCTGLVTLNGKTYSFDTDGTMQTGFVSDGAHTRYFAESGIMQTGWLEHDGASYYFDLSGIMAVGTAVIDGQQCKFAEDGKYQKPVRICLDAGHYGKYNPSPVNPAYYESDFNWKMHLYLKDALESYGIEVITTRPNQETDLAVEERGKTSEGCDLFLSIHSNASSSAADDGPLACCAINGSADDLGLALANLIHEVMGTRQGGSIWKRTGLRGDWYGVLRGATSVGTPAILLEHSFHTNLRATNWLLVDDNVRKMALAEAEFLAHWFGVI